MRAVITSAGAQARLLKAQEWLCARPRALVLGASLDAASEVARAAALKLGAAFGWQRFTLGRFAALLAGPRLARLELSPLSPLGLLGVCARVVHRMGKAGQLGRFQPLADQPGLPRALSRTLQEVRLAQARPGGDLGRILVEYEAELASAGLADRAKVFELALTASHELLGLPALLIDLPLQSTLEARLLSRLTGDVLAVAPSSDAARVSEALGVGAVALPEPRETSLSRVQQGLFQEEFGDGRPLGEDVSLLSAPGEARECVEIARLVLREAARGVPFDAMAVLLRAPSQYRPLLQEAFARAGVPAHFASGTLKPDPAGRAFLALLACAAEGLTARRFAEYLSLGEVPKAVQGGEPPPAPPSGDNWVPPDDELSPRPAEVSTSAPVEEAGGDAPVVEGTLRAPWNWEKFLLDAAVIGGRDRWQRRLDGLAETLLLRLAEAVRSGEDERALNLRRDLANLKSLRDFALPLIDVLAALPPEATWGEWLDQLRVLAARALRNPDRVLSLLAELQPMSPVGPVPLAEVRLVLGRRLTELPVRPASRRHGLVYVAETAAARGLAFEVVFVPGLAEKLFPQKVLEDPLLRDRERVLLEGLTTSEGRIAEERLALRLAVGAAKRAAVLSWPRIDLSQGRARVPSFYGLEVLRAAEGKLPAFSELSRRAEEASGARAGWPAPRESQDAIDEAEHDLSLLARAFGQTDEERKGTAAYLLEANPHLKRALRARARRWLKRWTRSDGLVLLDEPGQAVDPAARAALHTHLPSQRAFSPTALQNYSACPYKFVLQAIHRLGPREVPEAIDEIDPLERGSLIHEVQFELLRELQDTSALPIAEASLPAAQARLDAVLSRVAARYADKLAPAIERVWTDCIAAVSVDLREWLRRMTGELSWDPWRFELSFGLANDVTERDPHSTPDPVVLDEGLKLRGSIDLVERRASGDLRATDYKTGKAWAKPGVVIGGGSTLQPALYALVLEKLFPGTRVEGGRLYYSTYNGEFTPVDVPLTTEVRGSVQQLAQTISQAVEQGFLPAAPRKNDRYSECDRCDYLPVCGPGELQRVGRKPQEALEPLIKLRKLP